MWHPQDKDRCTAMTIKGERCWNHRVWKTVCGLHHDQAIPEGKKEDERTN